MINIWSLNGGNLLGTLMGHEGTISCLKARGNQLFSSSDDKTIRIWNVGNEELNVLNSKNADNAESLAREDSRPFSQGLKRNPCLLRVLHGHNSGVRSFDLNDNLLFSGDIYGSIRVWHIATGNCLCQIDIQHDGKYEMHIMGLLSIGFDRPKPIPKFVSDPITTIQ